VFPDPQGRYTEEHSSTYRRRAKVREATIQRRNTRRGQAFVAVAVGLIFSVLSVMLTAYDPLWNWLGVARDLRGVQTTAASITFVSLGFLLAMFFQQRDFHQELEELHRESSSVLLRSLPHSELFGRYTGDEAMRIIATLLPNSRYALNTRVFAETLNPTRNVGFKEWDSALRVAIRGGLTYKDVLSVGNESLARDRCASVAGGVGEYDAVIIHHQLPLFLNFIVLESRTGSKEVWFGWLISRGSGFAETNVIRTSEARIIAVFEQWHRELFAAGLPVTG
jgi:hypothetical protein